MQGNILARPAALTEQPTLDELQKPYVVIARSTTPEFSDKAMLLRYSQAVTQAVKVFRPLMKTQQQSVQPVAKPTEIKQESTPGQHTQNKKPLLRSVRGLNGKTWHHGQHLIHCIALQADLFERLVQKSQSRICRLLEIVLASGVDRTHVQAIRPAQKPGLKYRETSLLTILYCFAPTAYQLALHCRILGSVWCTFRGRIIARFINNWLTL